MSEIRDCLLNLVSVIEGTTPTTLLGRTGRAFVHAPEVPGAEQLVGLGSATRKFILQHAGLRARGATTQQRTTPRHVITAWTVLIAYPVTTSPYETGIVMAEDGQRLADRIADPVLWADTPVTTRTVEGATVQPSASGGTALLSLTVQFMYRPTYTP